MAWVRLVESLLPYPHSPLQGREASSQNVRLNSGSNLVRIMVETFFSSDDMNMNNLCRLQFAFGYFV